MGKLKLTVFIVIVGMATYAVVRGLAKEQVDQSCGAGATFSQALKNGGEGPAACGIEVASLVALDKAAREAAFMLLLLPGEKGAANEAAAEQMEKAAKGLTKKDRRVMAFVMKRDSADFARLVKNFRLKRLPAVVIAGKGCGASAVSDEITKDSLLAAFEKVTKKRSACCPARRK